MGVPVTEISEIEHFDVKNLWLKADISTLRQTNVVSSGQAFVMADVMIDSDNERKMLPYSPRNMLKVDILNAS